MVSVHFSDGVSGAVGEVVVEEADFFLPVPVRSSLTFREHERFAGVETAVHGREVD